MKNLTIVTGLIMIMGATIGTGFFKGEFDYCVSADGSYDSYVDSSTVITKQVRINEKYKKLTSD